MYMRFDTIIIGGGLSGLVCGIRLTQQGQRCVIISSGQSALHFSSGSFDLLNMLPNGDAVEDPVSSVKQLIDQMPDHPYAKIGESKFENKVREAESFLSGIGVQMQGGRMKNHYRITPMGSLKPTWLSMNDFAVSHKSNRLPWEKVSIFNIIGYLDFFPQFVADEFLKLGTESNIHLFNMKALEHLRRNPSELRSANIARVLDKNIEELAQILNINSKGSEAVILPACIGLDPASIGRLKQKVEKPVFFIPTMPPSIAGIYTQQYMRDYFQHLGGTYMLGDSVKRAEQAGNKVLRIYSFNHGDIPFIGENIVLATGSYFSQGLIATSDRIYEPVFDLDVSYSTDRADWYTPKMLDDQGYQHYGVKTDNSFRGLYRGGAVDNLFVAGAILEGFNPIKEGSGAGVSILSALSVAETILSK